MGDTVPFVSLFFIPFFPSFPFSLIYNDRFSVKHSVNGSDWFAVDNGAPFVGTSDRNSIKKVYFTTPVSARSIRIFPNAWFNRIFFILVPTPPFFLLPSSSPPFPPFRPLQLRHYEIFLCAVKCII